MFTCCTTNEIDKNWLIPSAASLIHFISLGFQYSIGLYFLPLSQTFDSNRGTTSWVGSLAVGTMLVFGFPAGYAMDVYDTRILLILASTLLSSGLLLGSFATSLPLLFVCIAVSGAACSIHIQVAGTVQSWFDKKKGFATGIAMAGSGLGNFIFAIAIGAFLASKSSTWRQALRWEAMFVFLFSIPASVLLRRRQRVQFKLVDIVIEEIEETKKATTDTNTNTTVSFCSLICEKRMLYLLVSKGIGAFAYGVPFVHLLPLMYDKGLTESEQALALALVGLASLCGRMILGIAGDKFGHTKMFQIGMFQLAVAMAIMPHCNSTIAFCTVAFYYGFFAGGYPSLPCSIISIWFSDNPDQVCRLIGVYWSAETIGAIAGPVMVGVMYDMQGNYVAAFTVQAGLLLVATISACMMPPASRQGKEEEEEEEEEKMTDLNEK